MSGASMPLRKGPSGPRADSGGLLAIGEDIVVESVSLVLNGAYLERSAGVPLEVFFTEWSAGDILVVEWSATAELTGDSGQLQVAISPAIDVGAGFQATNYGGATSSATGAQESVLSGSFAIACAEPPAIRLWANILTDTGIIDGTASIGGFSTGGAVLRCYRYVESLWVQGPEGALV